MKSHRSLLLFSCMMLLCSALTSLSAQNGAVITRGEGNTLFGFFNSEAQIVSLHATDPNFFCGPDFDTEPISFQLISLPHDEVSVYQLHGPVFTKVYWPATLDDIGADLCGFINGGPLVAEGIADFKYNDNDRHITLTRANSWGGTVVGLLYDLGGWCGNAGIVGFNFEYRMRIDRNGVFRLITWQGPRLSCQSE